MVYAKSEEEGKYYSTDYKVIEMEGSYYFVAPFLNNNDQSSPQKLLTFKYVEEKDSQQIVALLPDEFHMKLELTYCCDNGGKMHKLTGRVLMKFTRESKQYTSLEWDEFVSVLTGYPIPPYRPISVLEDSEIVIDVPSPPQEFIMDVILCDEKGKPITNPDGTYQLLSKFQHNKMAFVAFNSGQKFKLLLENKSDKNVIATVRIDNMYFHAFNESEKLAKDGIYLDLKAGEQRIVEGWLITTSKSKVFEIKPYIDEVNTSDDEVDIFYGRIDAEFSSAMTEEQARGTRGAVRKIEVAKPDDNSPVTEIVYFYCIN